MDQIMEELEDLEIIDRNDRTDSRKVVQGTSEDLDIVDLEGNSLSTVEQRLENPRLKSLVYNPRDKTFFTDSHNNALLFWTLAKEEGYLEGDTLLVHLDFHEDACDPGDRAPEDRPSTPQAVADTLKSIYVAEFINPAQRWGVVDHVYNWGLKNEELLEEKPSDSDLKELEPPFEEYDSVILDVDLDVFEGIIPYIEHEVEETGNDRAEIAEAYFREINELDRKADITSYATSPGFTDQDWAINNLRWIRNYESITNQYAK